MISRQKQYAQPYFSAKQLERSPHVSPILIYCISKFYGDEIDESTTFESLEGHLNKFLNNLEGDSFFIYHNAVEQLEYEGSDPRNLEDLRTAVDKEIDDYLNIFVRLVINSAHPDLDLNEDSNVMTNSARNLHRTGILRTFIRSFIQGMIKKNFVLGDGYKVISPFTTLEPNLKRLISTYYNADTQVYPEIPEFRTDYRLLMKRRYKRGVSTSSSEVAKEQRVQSHERGIVEWLDKVKEG